jgi:hypothetical protein
MQPEPPPITRAPDRLERRPGDQRRALHRGGRAASAAPMLVRTASDGAALRAECDLLERLPALAKVLQPRLIEIGGRSALSMQDPGGELLAARLERGRLDVGAALGIGRALARTLAELHALGWLACGLHPAALLCDAERGEAWLVDLGDAQPAAAPRRAPGLLHDAARLAWAAPEQTGRVEGPIDARSDLYALGVLLYAALAGAPPFRGDDPLALIHAHLARAPAELDAAVPAPLARLVMKLLAKSPDERFRSAAGLAADLDECARQWLATRHIEPFALGRHDAGERLALTGRLYGRERELARLLDAFERCCSAPRGGASAALLLVSGDPGIGKTALIQALARPIARREGCFVSGKFDQVVRGIPFGALIQALSALMRQLLGEPEARLAAWRERLAGALGANGGVLCEVIPELEFILGAQPPVVPLGRTEAQNRFQLVFRNFIAALAEPEHPLVVFLDDLQWADAATLGLLEPLLAAREGRGLLVIGACRDQALEAAPRLAHALAALDAAGVAV